MQFSVILKRENNMISLAMRHLKAVQAVREDLISAVPISVIFLVISLVISSEAAAATVHRIMVL